MRFRYILAVVALLTMASVAYATDEPSIDELDLPPDAEIVEFQPEDLNPQPMEIEGYKTLEWHVVEGPYVRSDGTVSTGDKVVGTMVPEDSKEAGTRSGCIVGYEIDDPYRIAYYGYYVVAENEIAVSLGCDTVNWTHQLKELDGGYWITHKTRNHSTEPGEIENKTLSQSCTPIAGYEDWLNWASGGSNASLVHCNKLG